MDHFLLAVRTTYLPGRGKLLLVLICRHPSKILLRLRFRDRSYRSSVRLQEDGHSVVLMDGPLSSQNRSGHLVATEACEACYLDQKHCYGNRWKPGLRKNIKPCCWSVSFSSLHAKRDDWSCNAPGLFRLAGTRSNRIVPENGSTLSSRLPDT